MFLIIILLLCILNYIIYMSYKHNFTNFLLYFQTFCLCKKNKNRKNQSWPDLCHSKKFYNSVNSSKISS